MAKTVSKQRGNSFASPSTETARLIAVHEGQVTGPGMKEDCSIEVRRTPQGIIQIASDAASAAGRFMSELGTAVAMVMRKPAVGITIAAMGVGIAAEKSSAALETAGASDLPYLVLGSQQMDLGARWVHATLPDGTDSYFSGAEIAPGWVLTAGHGVVTSGGTATIDKVGSGSNYLTSPGATSSVANVYVYPGYSSGFNSPDAALVHLNTPLTSNTLKIAPFPSVDDVLTSSGYGLYATVGGVTARDGNIRAFNATVTSTTPGNVSADFYVNLGFAPNSGVTLNGKGLAGDSGGPAFNSLDQFVGILDASFGGLNESGGTDILVAAQPQVDGWINQTITSVPEPSAFFVLVLGGSGLLLKRVRRT